jgi:hypothetical protein
MKAAPTSNGWATWTGAFTEVSITVDRNLVGSLYQTTITQGSTTVFEQSELRGEKSGDIKFAVATIVERKTTATTSATSSIDNSGVEPSTAPAQSVPFPTVVMVVGGVAGAFAGAWGSENG